MTDLAGRGALGQKSAKQPNGPRKPLSKISAKRKAYLASSERERAKRHMSEVARLPCLVCGAWPVEVHHLPDPRDDFRVIPLCPMHHRREFGPGAYHYSRKAFNAAHGSDDELLAIVARRLADSCGGD
jgi:hypothetical protein